MPYFGRMYNRQIFNILFCWFSGSYILNNSSITCFARFWVLCNIIYKNQAIALTIAPIPLPRIGKAINRLSKPTIVPRSDGSSTLAYI